MEDNEGSIPNILIKYISTHKWVYITKTRINYKSSKIYKISKTTAPLGSHFDDWVAPDLTKSLLENIDVT